MLNYYLDKLNDSLSILPQELEQASADHQPAVLDSEDLLFMLYTSGSTGKPKGIAHTQAGYLLYANMTMKVRLDLIWFLIVETSPHANIKWMDFMLYIKIKCHN